jgi:hypothetical protein
MLEEGDAPRALAPLRWAAVGQCDVALGCEKRSVAEASFVAVQEPVNLVLDGQYPCNFGYR